jgi:hydroxypyruvate isomerase
MSVIGRREAILATGAAGIGSLFAEKRLEAGQKKVVDKARLKQSVCRWCYNKIPLAEFCRGVADLGLTAMDLLPPAEWETARQFGLTCSMGTVSAGTIPNGLNNPAQHDTILKAFEQNVPLAAK